MLTLEKFEERLASEVVRREIVNAGDKTCIQ